MKAIIVEDEELTAERLHSLVTKHTSIKILTVLHSVKETTNWLEKNPLPDLIFLDIQLGDGSGFDILNRIDTFPHIIFTTAFDQYAIDAFKYNSIDYLLKPVKEKELLGAIDKLEKVNSSSEITSLLSNLQSRLEPDFKRKFLVKVGLKYHSYQTEEVAYFYSEEGETYLRTKEGKTTIIDHTLDSLDKQLDPSSFFRVNRHFIVCSDQIHSIDSYFNNRLIIKVAPGFHEEVIISRDRVKGFKKWMGE